MAASHTPQSGAALAYKVAAGVFAAGVFFIVFSGPLGGPVFAAIDALLGLLGAPADRGVLPKSEPETGSEVVLLLGGILLILGPYIFGVRLVVELLGVGEAGMTRAMPVNVKLGLGAALTGALLFLSGRLPAAFIAEVLLYDHEASGLLSFLANVARLGGFIFFVGIAAFILTRPLRLNLLLGWTDRVGWGKRRAPWLNRVGVALLLGAVIGALAQFDDATVSVLLVAGAAILIAGFLPDFFKSKRNKP